MENFSQTVETITVNVAIPVPGYMRDHIVSGRVVLPAVEALQILARTLPADAGVDPCRQERGLFSHLLPVGPGQQEIPAIHELVRYGDGRCLSRLITIFTGRQAGWTRRVEHVSVFFLPAGDREECSAGPKWPAPAGESDPIAGSVFKLSRRSLYEELVPFGSAYQNVTGDVYLDAVGAAAMVSGGEFQEAVGPLGSPFPADAAFHVACAWGQRYKGIIAFPVGFERRRIILPTRLAETYYCRTVFRPDDSLPLRFDIWLYGCDGQPVEVIEGVEMSDIYGGRQRPPAWVRET